MRIAVDVDGVLRNFVMSLITEYKKKFPEHRVMPYSEWDWELINNFPDYQGTRTDLYEWWSMDNACSIMTLAPPLLKIKKGFDLLLDSKHTPIIISTQRHGTEKYTLEWLGKNEINAREVYFARDKLSVGNADAIIEDKMANLQAFREAGKIAVAVSHPWNKEWDGEKAESFYDAAELLSIR